jgi:peptidyl-prolyl cis-trans isomerase A (cyclophilin A)
MRAKTPIILGLIMTAAAVLAVVHGQSPPPGQTAPGPDSAPVDDERVLDRDDLAEGWYVEIDTSLGTVLARLLPEQAPQAVAHFTALAEGRLEWTDPFTGEPRTDPYYDGLEIHKVEAGQRFEVGDPTGTGRGAAPFYLPPEGFGPVDFTWGWRLGMTRASLGRISGSLFFVTEAGLPWLNGKHPCFGVVIEGKDVVGIIAKSPADASGRPREPIVLEEIRIRRVGAPEPLPEPVHYTPKRLDFRLRDGLDQKK